MEQRQISRLIAEGQAILGIEFGSTRIKAVLIGEDHAPIAAGEHVWENRLENGVWTYRLEDALAGLQDAYAGLKQQVLGRYGVVLSGLRALGISGMMHGYLPLDAAGAQLAPFRTWRNTSTARAAEELTELFHFNIPQRWSVAHVYQALLDGEAHLPRLAHLTTLAGFIHQRLTGQWALGVGEASGMFPIDSETMDYDAGMIRLFDEKAAAMGCPWRARDILPAVLPAGGDGGRLTPEGARLLDPTGDLRPGALMAPPEGDAGTGMTATHSVAARTGNVSAGTSVFAMVVLERPLSRVYPEIDLVTTPDGKPVAMVHCNNCTSDLNAWAGMLQGFARACGREIPLSEIYPAIFHAAMAGEKDAGGVVNCNYLSGEPITGLEAGRPLLARMPDARATFENLARSLVLGAIVSLKLGMEILDQEQVKIDSLLGHGGFFKTPGTAQKLLAAALKTPVTVMETAGEGGPWGMALLAAYRARREAGETLESYLAHRVFTGARGKTAQPEKADAEGMDAYTRRFRECLAAERAAVEQMR